MTLLKIFGNIGLSKCSVCVCVCVCVTLLVVAFNYHPTDFNG